MKVEIVWEGGSGVDEDVDDYWYDPDNPNLLIVEYYDGSQEEYPVGNVVTEAGDDEEL